MTYIPYKVDIGNYVICLISVLVIIIVQRTEKGTGEPRKDSTQCPQNFPGLWDAIYVGRRYIPDKLKL